MATSPSDAGARARPDPIDGREAWFRLLVSVTLGVRLDRGKRGVFRTLLLDKADTEALTAKIETRHSPRYRGGQRDAQRVSGPLDAV